VAHNLARLGVAVLIPRLPHLRSGELAPGDVETLVSAFEWLASQPEIAADRVGFGGFCVGSSLALLAAENPRIADQVALVNVFGGYYNLRTYIRAIAARSAFYQDREYPWRPAADTEALLVSNILYYLDSPEDAALIRAHFSGQPVDAPLTSAGNWAVALLSSTDSGTIDDLLENLPDGYDIRLDAMSPSAGIERLQAKLYVMHDLSDPFVPVMEGRRLMDSISGRLPVQYTEFTLFEHVRPANDQDRIEVIGEATRLIRFLAPLMADLE
jgi:dipeptidyl aminopeptidase/acylaminoacyl peptidase